MIARRANPLAPSPPAERAARGCLNNTSASRYLDNELNSRTWSYLLASLFAVRHAGVSLYRANTLDLIIRYCARARESGGESGKSGAGILSYAYCRANRTSRGLPGSLTMPRRYLRSRGRERQSPSLLARVRAKNIQRIETFLLVLR